MPIEHIFDEADIQELINQNANPPFGARNSALILGGVYWGLTPLEMCSITIEDVIAPNGQFYKEWVLPAQFAYGGEAREIHTADHVLPFFEKYLEMRLERLWGLSNLHTYRGLSPASHFFLNDSGRQYNSIVYEKNIFYKCDNRKGSFFKSTDPVLYTVVDKRYQQSCRFKEVSLTPNGVEYILMRSSEKGKITKKEMDGMAVKEIKKGIFLLNEERKKYEIKNKNISTYE